MLSRKSFALAAGAFIAMSLLGPIAGAAQPHFLHLSGDFTDTDTESCGFPIVIDEHFTADVKFFLNAAGDPVRSLNHLTLRGTDTAKGVSLLDTASFTHSFDFTTGVNGNMGLNAHIKLPHGGTVAIDAGRVLTDENGNVLFAAGNHDFLQGNLASYCAAFGG